MSVNRILAAWSRRCEQTDTGSELFSPTLKLLRYLTGGRGNDAISSG